MASTRLSHAGLLSIINGIHVYVKLKAGARHTCSARPYEVGVKSVLLGIM